MASLELRSERYRIVFRFGGRKFQHPLKTADEAEALSCLARLEENLRLLERGRLVPPPGADLPTFLLSDGKLAGKPAAPVEVDSRARTAHPATDARRRHVSETAEETRRRSRRGPNRR